MLAVSLLCAVLAHAGVDRIEVEHRASLPNGQAFGAGGAYEKLSGQIVFAVDPVNAYNQRITDLAPAPRFANAPVFARADFMLLRPADSSTGNGVARFAVSNCGGKASRRAWPCVPGKFVVGGGARNMALWNSFEALRG